MASDATDSKATAQSAADAAAHKEAMNFWHYLIKPDKCGTELFDRLLKGIAEVISKTFEPSDSPDLTPTQLAAFYRAVGGNYDVLFIETPPTSLSFIYRSLGAFHSLQPAPNDDGYSSPTLPALKKQGYVTWQTIQLLLGPEDHVLFLQNAVKQFDVVDPKTGNLFPKLLPKDCLPDKPDEAMEAWYETVAARLKREAEEDSLESGKVPHVRVGVSDHGPRASADLSSDSADEKHAAASYFSDPLYRKARHTRPPPIRHFPKQTAHPYEDATKGRVMSSVRHMFNPFSKTRRVTERYDEDSLSEDDRTPIAPVPPPVPRYASHPSSNAFKRPHPPRRESTLSSTSSESDSDGPSRRRTPILRQRRSHEPPDSSREYFPSYYEDRRYPHDVPGPPPQRREEGPPPLYGPTKAPLFATQVAQLEANKYYERRPSMPPRTSYRPSVRYAAAGPPPPVEVVDPPYFRERSRDRDPDRDRERDRDRGYERYRRHSEEFPREREREREREGLRDRTRSHDRVKDDWDERDERSRERDVRGGRTHRYVASVQDGVGGRRYPVEPLWR